jgi:anti-anti-sigma factor
VALFPFCPSGPAGPASSSRCASLVAWPCRTVPGASPRVVPAALSFLARPGCSSRDGAWLVSSLNGSTAEQNGPPGPDTEAAVWQSPRTGRISIEIKAGLETITILVGGELDLVTMPFLAEQLTLVSRDKPRRLVFDLARTDFMDCGSARLIAAAGKWLPEGRRPVIRRPCPGVRRILELTGLDAYCEIEELTRG